MGLGLELRVEGESNKRVMKQFDNKKHGWLKLAVEIVVVIILVLLVLSFIFGVSRVDGQSMEPTLENNQVVSFIRIGNNYDYGDIVAIKMPNGDRYVKRIIGLPGDEIDIIGGYVYRNGQRLEEDYIKGAEAAATDTTAQSADTSAQSADTSAQSGDSVTGATGKVTPGGQVEGTTQPVGNRIEYPVKVPQGKYWVMGDNRENSKDSRDFGPVIKENIKGKLLFQ